MVDRGMSSHIWGGGSEGGRNIQHWWIEGDEQPGWLRTAEIGTFRLALLFEIPITRFAFQFGVFQSILCCASHMGALIIQCSYQTCTDLCLVLYV